MKLVHLINETYQVIENGEVLYQGSLANCEAYIRCFDKSAEVLK